MTHLLYIANARIPTEKAHGLQIMHNCEAFAQAGARVTLWAARRVNTPELRAVRDPFAHYGVEPNFRLARVPCIDLMGVVGERFPLLTKAAFVLQMLTFTLAMLAGALFTRADIYYTRDLPVILALSLIRPRRALAYEPHRRSASGVGRWLQDRAVRRAGALIPVTPPLARALIDAGADPSRVLPQHDGFRRQRFAHLPDQAAARAHIGWPPQAFIVGYVGRLHTMSMDKGVGILIEALRGVEGATLALVGGPDAMAAALRQQWLDTGLPEAHFLYAGQVPADHVPLYLSAFDVCAMPFPHTTHFAQYASPLKLFEYMAAGRAIVASDMPAWADVLAADEHALLTPPGDVDALAAAIRRLRDDPGRRARLGAAARARALAHYTWDARAQAILAHIRAATD
jgi:glycosyltransferase involved in cell wall biosynthesis